MKKKKNLVSLFYLNDNIAGKDMFLVPKYLSEALGMECTIVFPRRKENEHLCGELRGVKLVPIRSGSEYYSSVWREKERLWWLIRHARQIDVLSLFWLNKRNLIFARVYKLLNPKGICYIKGDFNEQSLLASGLDIGHSSWKHKIKNWLSQSVDVLSAETPAVYRYIQQGGMGKALAKVVALLPNAMDDKLCQELAVEVKEFDQKCNLMITVGRIGTLQKHNELVLQALDGLDMKNWQFKFIGPIDPAFQIQYDDFICRNPDKKNKVLMTGNMNKEELWKEYSTAKVFVLTSLYEGFPNVFAEALYFGDYILTTSVSSAEYVTKGGSLGEVIPIDGVQALRDSLSAIINGEKDLKNIFPHILDFSEGFKWSGAIQPLAQLIKAKLINNEKAD